MKLRLLSILLVCLLCLGLVACQEKVPQEVLGTWASAGSEYPHTLQIREDNTLVIIDGAEEPEEDLVITYRWEDGQLVLESPYADDDAGITLRLKDGKLVRYEYGMNSGITYTKK